MNSKKIPLFEVDEIWQVGTRIYFGDEFVSISPFEKEYYEFFTKLITIPTFELTSDSFCKRINHIYIQKIDELKDLTEKIKKCDEFTNVELKDKSSAIGLPNVVSYTHKETGITTEFDGVIFVSEKRISDKSLPINEAKNIVENKGKIYIDRAQTGSPNTEVWNIFFKNSSAHCKWRYVTKKAGIDEFFKTKQFYKGKIILDIILFDTNIITITQPTNETIIGENFSFLVGNKEHICQVIAHEAEIYRYLNFLENRLTNIRDEILYIRENLLKPSPLLPLNPRSIIKYIKYYMDINKSLQKTIEYRIHIFSFEQVLNVFKRYEEEGISFFNIENQSVQIINEEYNPRKLNQWHTYAPKNAIIYDDFVIVNDYDKSLCDYAGYPEKLLKFQLWIKEILDDTVPFIRSITDTLSLQSQNILVIITLFLLIITLLTLIFSILH